MDIKTEKFRSLQEVKKYLDEIAEQIRLDEQRIEKSITTLGRKLQAVKIMDINTPSGTSRRKKTINVNFPLVKVPNKEQLGKDYKLAEELSERYKSLMDNQNQIRMAFKDSKGPQFQALMAQFQKLKSAIEAQLKKLFAALAKVAEGHAPKEFKNFLVGVAEEIAEHLEFDDSKNMIYASVNGEGQLVFAAYIILTNAVSDEGKVAPHLYLVIKWTVGENVEIFVEHEFVAPTLLEGGATVENLQQAAKAIKYQLSLEGFSSQIGTLPVSMQIRTPAEGLNKNLFTVKDYISKIEAARDEIIFVLKTGIKSSVFKEIQSQLFQEVKAMLKQKRSTKLRMRTEGNKIIFTIVNIDHSSVTPAEVEWLADKYGLPEHDLRKIVNTINQGKTK